MDSRATADANWDVGRRAVDTALRSGEHVSGDTAREAADALGASAVRPVEIPVAPVGGPEYTGRA
jgi:hypothetical protein